MILMVAHCPAELAALYTSQTNTLLLTPSIINPNKHVVFIQQITNLHE